MYIVVNGEIHFPLFFAQSICPPSFSFNYLSSSPILLFLALLTALLQTHTVPLFLSYLPPCLFIPSFYFHFTFFVPLFARSFRFFPPFIHPRRPSSRPPLPVCSFPSNLYFSINCCLIYCFFFHSPAHPSFNPPFPPSHPIVSLLLHFLPWSLSCRHHRFPPRWDAKTREIISAKACLDALRALTYVMNMKKRLSTRQPTTNSTNNTEHTHACTERHTV